MEIPSLLLLLLKGILSPLLAFSTNLTLLPLLLPSSEIYFLLFFLPLVLHFSLEIKVLYRFLLFRPSVSPHRTKLLFSCPSLFRNFPPRINYLLSLDTSQKEIKFEVSLFSFLYLYLLFTRYSQTVVYRVVFAALSDKRSKSHAIVATVRIAYSSVSVIRAKLSQGEKENGKRKELETFGCSRVFLKVSLPSSVAIRFRRSKENTIVIFLNDRRRALFCGG